MKVSQSGYLEYAERSPSDPMDTEQHKNQMNEVFVKTFGKEFICTNAINI